MGEMKRVSLARGKRVLKVAPVAYPRDPNTVAVLVVLLGSGGESASAHLTEDERRALIEALGGEVR